MDANIPNPALLRAYPSFVNNQLQPPHLPNQLLNQLPNQLPPQLAAQVPNQLSSHPQLPNLPGPQNQTTPSPDTNACEKLIHLARSIRARPVYEIQRIGGEDHQPLFRACLLLIPQNYSTQGVGRSKMTARRDAATNMIKIINEKALGGQFNVGETVPHLLPSPPKVEIKEEPAGHEMEEGELESDDADDEEKAAPFFVDREPDPELEKEAQHQRLLEEGSSTETIPQSQEKQQELQQPHYAPAKQEEVPTEKTAPAIAKSHSAVITKTEQTTNVPQTGKEEPHQVPKRACSPLEQEPVPTAVEAPSNDLGYAIPPRKRAKPIQRDFPTRLRMWIFCNYTDHVMNTLKALAEANLFVDLSITMFTAVELPKYVLLGRSVAAEVSTMPESQRKSPTAMVASLAFAVGAEIEKVWVARAKHVAKGYPSGLCPRVLLLHDDPSLDVVAVDNVVEVMRSTDDVVRHITGVLESSKNGSFTAT